MAVGSDGGKPSGFGEFFSSTRKELFFVHLFVSYFLGLSFVDFLAGLLSPGELGPDDAVELVAVFVVTAPLSIAVAIVAGFVYSERSQNFVVIALVAFLALAACTWAGNELYANKTVTPLPSTGGGPFSPAISYLKGYLQVYGPALFMSGITIGGYLGWKAVPVFQLKAR